MCGEVVILSTRPRCYAADVTEIRLVGMEDGRFERKDLLCSGAFSDVYEAVDETTEEPCALKEYSMFRLKKLNLFGYQGRMNGIEAVQMEMQIMKNIQKKISSYPSSSSCHETILKLLDAYEDTQEHSLVIVMELAVFGKSMSLHKEIIIATDGAWDEIGEEDNFALTYWSYRYTLLGNNSYNNNNSKEEERDPEENNSIYFDEHEALNLFHQLIEGVKFLHSIGICHLDLKPENLLITGDHRLKISDFGSSVEFDLETSQKGLISHTPGTPAFWPPEFVHSFESDADERKVSDIKDVFDGDADEFIKVQWLDEIQE